MSNRAGFTYPPPAPPPEESDATRYLCAATYLDEHFARRVLDEVVHQPHRAVALSHEMGLGPVIRHAFVAVRRRLMRDTMVTAALILGFGSSFLGGLITVVAFVSLWVLVRGFRHLAAREVAAGLLLILVGLFLGGPFIIVVLLGSLFAPLLYQLPLFELLLPGLYYGDGSDAPSVASMWVVIVVIWLINVLYRFWTHRTLAEDLAPGRFDPARSPDAPAVHRERLHYIETAQTGNVTCYAQDSDTRPFLGFGAVTQKWTLVTPLAPPRAGGDMTNGRGASGEVPTVRPSGPPATEPSPFTLDELYNALRTGSIALADQGNGAEFAVPHLTIHDRIFLAGRLPMDSPYLERGRPRSHLAAAEINELQRAERGRTRHYQSVRMAAWAGEVEVNTFVYATFRGGMLFVEFVATTMPGIRGEYHAIDTYERLDGSTIVRIMGRSVGDVIKSPLAPVALVRAAMVGIRRALSESADRQRIHRQLMFDYGCRISVRELGADFQHVDRFHIYDADERVSVVERRLVQIVVDFLHHHGFDVGELVGQATTIINNTRVNNSNTFNNSTLNSSPVAAGNSATASSGVTPGASSPSNGPSTTGR